MSVLNGIRGGRRLMPAAIALGTATFTMFAAPDTPAIENAVVMPFLGAVAIRCPRAAMESPHVTSAEVARRAIERGLHDPAAFRAALLDVPARDRDAWVDRVLGIGDLPNDGPALPAGGVPYLPCSVEVLLRMIDEAPVGATDVFVDVGAGPGRVIALVHLLTGASAIGLEIQPELAGAARGIAARLGLSRVACIEGDAAASAAVMVGGSVFFLYCPFSGARLAKVLDDLEPLARTRPLRVCCVDLPLPPRSWLTRAPGRDAELEIYRSA